MHVAGLLMKVCAIAGDGACDGCSSGTIVFNLERLSSIEYLRWSIYIYMKV